ncbi:MAG TPA: glycosyl hydrolase [Chryseosolibacter sp.]|nr:glycosyl hydrolase [Chryseosolibacter sp.]
MLSLRVPLIVVFLVIAFSCTPPAGKTAHETTWPAISHETKPWARWWWQGNALTKEGITAEMEAYHKAGIGGLEITPIYGVYGEEEHFIDYLSPQWMELLTYVLKEAERLDMGIDMATGTGWPFGGPWVTAEDACKNMQHKKFQVNGGGRLVEKLEFIQQPYLRVLGTRITPDGNDGKAPLINARDITIADLVEPVGKNKNLQALAIEQVQFEKTLPLICLMAYSNNGEALNLTSKVNSQGILDWTAPAGTWTLYALFEGWHGKMVERAGPGGEGDVIDHFSVNAVDHYLKHFDDAFNGHDIRPLRAFFNDSYEVDDARGNADFTPELFEEFNKRRGYDLRTELPALLGEDTPEKNERVRCDYRETLSELLLDHFTTRWKKWAHSHDAIVRNQAHGSPSNILDLYAVVDIPEIEGTEPLRFKMATSSGNVTGKRLISAEAATWLNEHFESNLADIKAALDKYLLYGVNHLVYHGTCYSPPGEPWPGRLFYAAVHMNPRNPLWKDADVLNAYIARCQSFLQNASADNDILLYYPIYDPFSRPGREMIEHFDGIGRAFEGTSFAKAAQWMLDKGYTFDYISDKQIRETAVENESLKTSGGGIYKTIVVPACKYMPVETLEKLSAFADAGAHVIFVDAWPGSPAGYHDLTNKTKRFERVIQKMKELAQGGTASKGKTIQQGSDLGTLLGNIDMRRETMFDVGIRCLRKKNSDGSWLYFINNTTSAFYEGWLPVSSTAKSVVLFDPITVQSGAARTRMSASGLEVFVQLQPSGSIILKGYSNNVSGEEFPYREIAAGPVVLQGKCKVTFDSGGPELPPAFENDSLVYWTSMNNDAYKNFSGTATYTLAFDKPKGDAKRWLLQFDSVRESAEVIMNGKSVGTMIGPVYQLVVSDTLLHEHNVLEIKVSNLMANRIAWMDRNHIMWKKFYNVNFPAHSRENSKNGLFDASGWKPKASGIEGKAELIPLK